MSTEPGTAASAPDAAEITPETVAALTKVLVRAVRELADAGKPRRAGVIAAEGWKLLRGVHPAATAHLDGAMHYIARKDSEPVPVVGTDDD